MIEGLAEQVLLELTANYALLKEDWSDDVIEFVKDSALILMDIAGEMISCEDAKQMSLELLLERFLTGTEKTKTWGKCRVATPSAQGPITALSLVSSAKEAKDFKDKNKIERQKDADLNVRSKSSDSNKELFSELDATPEYLRAKLLMEAAGVSSRQSTKAGFRLLELRANKEMQSITCDEVLSIQQQAREGWSKLQQECKQRSFRVANHSTQNLRRPTTPKSARKRSAAKSFTNTKPKHHKNSTELSDDKGLHFQLIQSQHLKRRRQSQNTTVIVQDLVVT
jgi:hypothetical protein